MESTKKKNLKTFAEVVIMTLLICLVSDMAALAQWGYSVGQKEIPGVVIQKDTSAFKVYPNHPRLFFRDTDLAAIKERINGDYKNEWQEMLANIEAQALNGPAAKYAEGSFLKNWTTGRNIAFVARITGEEKYIKWSKSWAEALASAGTTGNDDQYRGRLMSLAVAYDWLYPWLSDKEKERIQMAILEHIEKNWYFATGADYVGGHSRWGNFSLATGLLVLVTERPELRKKLMIVRNNWINGYHPVQGWVAADGGYHMGWAYSAAYLTGDNHCVWSSATNECVYYPWQGLMSLFWIYGRQGDGLYPNTGDAYTISDDLNMERELLMTGAGIFKNPYAAWMARPTTDRFADILYGDKNVKPIRPDDQKAPLPLSRYFRNAGVVIARDRWDEKTTLLQFRSVPFYSSNHHHRDENCFTLHYKGALAIDAGLYDEGGPNGGYGSRHWLNYFTRTIAHNGILVFDPSQKMEIYNKTVSNDGGQTYRKEPRSLKDLLPGGMANLDGIIQYSNTKDYTYIAGDATKAYDADRVKLAQRNIVYLRNTSYPHPVIVIFDRVESSKPEFEKRFLLHTVNKPAINGKVTVAENKGGRLSCLTLYPEDANLQLIGGPGKEAWVNGLNYPVDAESFKRPNLRPIEPGSWRLEVSPRTQQLQNYFLHILFVNDIGAKQVDSSDAELIREKSKIGVKVDRWKIMFPLVEGGAAIIRHKNLINWNDYRKQKQVFKKGVSN